MLIIYINISCLVIIFLSKWGETGPDTFAKFCSMPTLNILGKIINIVFALPKGNVQHEFSLRSILEPVGWKFQILYLSCVQKIDNLSSVYGISGETIRIPRKYPVRFPALQKCQ